jgi:catalase
MTASTAWTESVAEGEAAELEALAEQIRELQRRAARGRPPRRALHAKGILGVEAELEVLPDLPEPTRVGIFAAPAKHKALVRFSNGAGHRLPDRRPDVRGVAIKVFGVPGKKLIPGLEEATTQDFLLITQAAQPFRDAREFVWFVTAAADGPLRLLPRVVARKGFFAGLAFLRTLLGGVSRPVPSLATLTTFSAVPIRFGAHAAKYSLAPHAAPARGRTPADLGAELAARLGAGPVGYDLRVQFFVDDERTPIEDGTREWRAEDAPWVTVARLTLPQQDVASEAGRAVAERVEKLSFDPWHAPVDFRPLGQLMRARNHAYRLSTIERQAASELELP